jgi:DNA-binding transcriptional regulator of glucitol operon
VRRFGFALRPGWLLLHVFSASLIITMVLLGRWQLHVSEAKHFSLQNFGYTIQWWLFSAFTAALWLRIVRDAAQRRGQAAGRSPGEAPAEPATPEREIVEYRRYVMPTPQPAPSDSVHAAYNDYLASLAAKDAEEQTR